MRFFSTALSFALAALTAVASAQASTKGNAITAPIRGESIDAGSTYTIRWMNIVGGRVTLTLMNGPENGLTSVGTIVSGTANSGSYTWSVPENTPAGDDYTIRISYDTNSNNFNYSDRFTISSDVTATPTSSTARSTSSTSASSSTESTESITSTSASSEPSSTASTGSTTGTESGSTTAQTSTTRRSTSSPSASATGGGGAPQSGSSSNLSSPLAVIMAVLATALFLH